MVHVSSWGGSGGGSPTDADNGVQGWGGRGGFEVIGVGGTEVLLCKSA